MRFKLRNLLLSFLVGGVSAASFAQAPQCLPCAGLVVERPADAATALAEVPLASQEVLFVKWTADLEAPRPNEARAVVASGAIPWIAVPFSAAPPLVQNLEQLERELVSLAALAAGAGERAHFQLEWPASGSAGPEEWAFLIKRAAVVISGAAPAAQVLVGLTSPSSESLEKLYDEEVAAYLDGVALSPMPEGRLAEVALLLQTLDPGIVVAADALAQPNAPEFVLVAASRAAAAGANVALIEIDRPDSRWLAPFRRLAADFQGDLSMDVYSVPTGADEAWSFVRGEDLSLRVVVRAPEGAASVRLNFPDPQLHKPAVIDLETGAPVEQYGLRSGSGFEVEIEAPPPAFLLSLERMSAAELEGVSGVEERLTVEDTRQMPVDEILRRLQAFEDAQSRRLTHYEAVNTSHLRFQVGTGAGSVEVSFSGDYLVRQGESFDWAWREFYVNGVKWRNKTIPEIPLLQPEKATALPVEINFSKDYRYSLRGTGTANDRDCWVVDFEPVVALEEGRTLYQGTVWIDREIYARVQTRAVQLGLAGDVLSNDETISFSPVDANGEPAPWNSSSYFLPLHLVGQQIWSVLSNTTIVERELKLTNVRINADGFEERRQALFESELTIVRDTDVGLRYLVVDEETGERVVQEELDSSRRFLVGGILHDDSLDFPLPLAGINWLWFDWRGTGTQANIFFAGPLVTIAVTDPDFRGSKFDLGFDAFAIAFAGTDTLFRDGQEAISEDVEVFSPSLDLKIGRPFGSYAKVDLEYELEWRKFSTASDTSSDFVLPRDHFNHGLTLTGRYNRRGYRFVLSGNYNLRSDWEEWGLPGNNDFDPDSDTYLKWRAGVGKTWHMPNFLKFGLEFEHLDGSRLDRFSKYEFGVFSDVTVHGYQSDKIRAEEVTAAHATYGFDVGALFRLDLIADGAWATDTTSGFDQEFLGGVGVAGTVVGPWQTVINLDLGVAVAGPDTGFTAFLTVLKLFKK